MVLPVDVVDHIFSFLREDLATLKLCTQAHPLLSGLAERHIYRSTALDVNPDCTSDITHLSLLLEKKPQIRNCVRSLSINIPNNSAHLVSAQTPVIKAMSSILSSLPGLNKVTLMLSTLSWTTTDETFRTALINIFQQSSVTEVHLDYVYAFPLQVLDTCQNIKTLTLSNCQKFQQLESTPPSHHLESLSILSSDDQSLFGWASNHNGSLTSLKLRPQEMELSALPKLLDDCATSLTRLELDMHDLGQSQCFAPDDDFYSHLFPESLDINAQFPFTLSALSNLQHLTIWTLINADQEDIDFDGKIEYHDFAFYTAFRAIARLIELSAPSLQQVVLKIHCWDFSVVETLAELKWSPLILLGDSPTCPHIDLCISVEKTYTRCGFSPEEIKNALAWCPGLTRLVDLGVFSIKPETKDQWLTR